MVKKNKKEEEKSKFLLYRVEPFLKLLSKKDLKVEDIKEEYIEKIFGENLSDIFPNLIFLDTQFCLETPGKKEVCRIDTLAFNKKENYFVAIEYKRTKSSGLGSQIKNYLWCLEDIHNQYNLLEILNSKTRKKFKYNEINWTETKGICIVAESDKRTDWLRKETNTALIEISFYDEDILYINTEILPKWLKVATFKKKNLESKPKPEETKKSQEVEIINSSLNIDNIANADWLSLKVKDYFLKIDKILAPQRKKWLSRQVSSINEKKGYVIINYRQNQQKKITFSVVIWRNQINIYGIQPPEISQSLSELFGNYDIVYRKEKHIGTGDWHFPFIKNKNDFQKLKNFFLEYKEKFPENSEIFK